jgi:SMODS and SLOG-associating 2TM effector domain 1/SMODS and SLOG-associating 2TM effector domain 3
MELRRLPRDGGALSLARLSTRADASWPHRPAPSGVEDTLPDVVIEPGDYPATLRAARVVAALAQRRYFAFLVLQLGAAFLGALFASVAAAVDSPSVAQGWRQASAVALLVSFVVLLLGRVLRTDALWWDARAVAESLRSSAWRFMMRAPAFESRNGASPEELFRMDVVETLKARPDISAAVERRRDDDASEISALMQETRRAPLEERRAFYAQQRLDDQKRWYADRARSHERAREACFLAAMLVQLAAVHVAFLQWRPWRLNLVPLLVAIAASVTTWAQARRHEESAQAYAFVRQELDVMAVRLETAADEAAFEAAVAATEDVFSREHTMWMARRNR